MHDHQDEDEAQGAVNMGGMPETRGRCNKRRAAAQASANQGTAVAAAAQDEDEDEDEDDVVCLDDVHKFEAVAEQDLHVDYVPTEVNDSEQKVMTVNFNNERFRVVIRDGGGGTVRGGQLFQNKHKNGSYLLNRRTTARAMFAATVVQMMCFGKGVQ